VPIATASGVVGVIYANQLTVRPFSEADEAALVTLADHAAVAAFLSAVLVSIEKSAEQLGLKQ